MHLFHQCKVIAGKESFEEEGVHQRQHRNMQSPPARLTLQCQSCLHKMDQIQISPLSQYMNPLIALIPRTRSPVLIQHYSCSGRTECISVLQISHPLVFAKRT
uniref:Uncharacterized protein n=1 Tax=Arundo donax TaxID=35708 RepID=A0A0A9DQP2_ARUDO